MRLESIREIKPGSVVAKPLYDNRGQVLLNAGVELTEKDRWICSQVGPSLREQGLTFVGLDVIGPYLTEINVTSPTCIRELDSLYNADIASQVIDAIAVRLAAR